MDALGVLRPDETPHATAYVDRMVDLVADLVERGVAYETADGVYLSVTRRARLRAAGPPAPRLPAGRGPGGGRRGEALAPRLRAVEEGQAGRADVGVARGGRAGPGWHTECVVMSLDLLGRRVRAPRRGPGPDVPPPRERAGPGGGRRAGSSPATGCTTAGSPWTARRCPSPWATSPRSSDLLDRSDARAYRLLVLRSHYRSPIEVTPDTIADAEAGLARLDELARRFELADPAGRRSGRSTGPAGGRRGCDRRGRGPVPAADGRRPRHPGALAGVFDLVRRANAAADAGDDGGRDASRPAPRRCCARRWACALRAGIGDEVDPAAAELVRRRDEARAERDWAQADALRGRAGGAGWVVEDGPEGTRIRRQ